MAPASAAAAEGAEGEAPAAAAAEVAVEDAGVAAEAADVPAAEDAAAATVCQPPYVPVSGYCCDYNTYNGGPATFISSYRVCSMNGGSTTTTVNGVSTTTGSSGGFQMPAMDASGCSIGSSGCADMKNSGACVLLHSTCTNGNKCARQSVFGMPSC